jgi:hypothetical protein
MMEMDTSAGRDDYIRKVLEAYRNTPGTCGQMRRADRVLALQLYLRGISFDQVENALVLAAVRRLIRPAGAPPLGTVRSLAYFLPVIEEVLENKISDDYFQYARRKLRLLRPG